MGDGMFYGSFDALIFLFAVAWLVLTGVAFLIAPKGGLGRWDAHSRALLRQSSHRTLRLAGQLDQQTSRPILGRDGGRGPAGGRLLLPRRSFSPWLSNGIVATLPAATCLFIGWMMLGTEAEEFMGIVVFAFICCVALAWLAAPWWLVASHHWIEVETGPAAVGDLLKVRAPNRRSHSLMPAQLRLRLIERVRSQNAVIGLWTEEVLWDEAFATAEVALQSPFRSQFAIRIPEHLPGTHLAPGYRLEWIIEVADGGEATSYPIPVVK